MGQRRRRCSYCGNIIDISKANLAIFDTPEQASAAVKEFNASKGGDEFKEAVERSREHFKSLLPPQQIDGKDISDDERLAPPQGKRRILMAILEKEAQNRPCSLDKLEKMIETEGLEWTWVEKQIESLANSGVLIFPRPWTIQLVIIDDKLESSASSKDVTEDIISLLKSEGGATRVDEIIDFFTKRGISEDSVENSLERLMRSGDIYQPRPGFVQII